MPQHRWTPEEVKENHRKRKEQRQKRLRELARSEIKPENVFDHLEKIFINDDSFPVLTGNKK